MDSIWAGGGKLFDFAQQFVGGRRVSLSENMMLERAANGIKRGVADITRGATAKDGKAIIRGIDNLANSVAFAAGAPYSGPLQAVKSAGGLAARAYKGEPVEVNPMKRRPRIARKHVRKLPNSPTFIQIEQGLTAAYNEANGAGLVSDRTDTGKFKSPAQRKSEFTRIYLLQLEKARGKAVADDYKKKRAIVFD